MPQIEKHFQREKKKIQNKINQLNLEQEKLILEEENKQSKELSLSKLKKYLENGEIITEFDKDAFEILVKQVIIGGYDEKDKADPKQVTFVLKNESKVNYEDYLQTRDDIHEKSLQMSDHTSGLIRYYNGNNLILINKDATSFDNVASLVIKDSLGNIFKNIQEE